MIGIISTSLKSFIIMDKIRKKYNNIDIYIYNNDLNIDKKIRNLVNKGCKIIIVDDISINIQDYYNIFFLDLEKNKIEVDNSYFFPENQIINWIEEGNEKMIQDYLCSIKIEKDKIIILKDIRMLFIKDEISKIFNNKIIDSMDWMITRIDDFINTNNIDCHNNGISRYLVDE